jgi:hypothetical protein
VRRPGNRWRWRREKSKRWCRASRKCHDEDSGTEDDAMSP